MLVEAPVVDASVDDVLTFSAAATVADVLAGCDDAGLVVQAELDMFSATLLEATRASGTLV